MRPHRVRPFAKPSKSARSASFLDCGILTCGLLRGCCVDCTREKPVMFSRKRRVPVNGGNVENWTLAAGGIERPIADVHCYV
jgi:hypothetical protein